MRNVEFIIRARERKTIKVALNKSICTVYNSTFISFLYESEAAARDGRFLILFQTIPVSLSPFWSLL